MASIFYLEIIQLEGMYLSLSSMWSNPDTWKAPSSSSSWPVVSIIMDDTSAVYLRTLVCFNTGSFLFELFMRSNCFWYVSIASLNENTIQHTRHRKQQNSNWFKLSPVCSQKHCNCHPYNGFSGSSDASFYTTVPVVSVCWWKLCRFVCLILHLRATGCTTGLETPNERSFPPRMLANWTSKSACINKTQLSYKKVSNWNAGRYTSSNICHEGT